MTDKNNAMPLEFSKLGNELSKKFELGFFPLKFYTIKLQKK